MIILEEGCELIHCSCGTHFIVEPKDVRVYNTGKELIKVVECPQCQTPHHTIIDIKDGSEIIDILPITEKEKEDDIKEKTEESKSKV